MIPGHYQKSFNAIRSSADLKKTLEELKQDLCDEPSFEFEIGVIPPRRNEGSTRYTSYTPLNDEVINNIEDPILRIMITRICENLDEIIGLEGKLSIEELPLLDSIATNIFLAHYLLQDQKTIVTSEIRELRKFERSQELKLSVDKLSADELGSISLLDAGYLGKITEQDSATMRAFKHDYLGLVKIEEAVNELEEHLEANSRINLETLVDGVSADLIDDSIHIVLDHFQQFIDQCSPVTIDRVYSAVVYGDAGLDISSDDKLAAIYDELSNDLEAIISSKPEMIIDLAKWLSKAQNSATVPQMTKSFASIATKLASSHAYGNQSIAIDFAEFINQIPDQFEDKTNAEETDDGGTAVAPDEFQSLNTILNNLDQICPLNDEAIFDDEYLNDKALKALETCPARELQNLTRYLTLIQANLQEDEDHTGAVIPAKLADIDFEHFFIDEGRTVHPDKLWYAFWEICSSYQLDIVDD